MENKIIIYENRNVIKMGSEYVEFSAFSIIKNIKGDYYNLFIKIENNDKIKTLDYTLYSLKCLDIR